jgi:GNAT superfamily N-acetyltransferase
VILRDAQPADADALAALLIESRRTHLPYAPIAHADADVHRWMREQLLPHARVRVAEIDNEIAGFSATEREGELLWIAQMYVAAQRVGGGIGSALLREILAAATGPVRLYTFQANTSARRFYERHGFRALVFTDGRDNEERCPDVLYEWQPQASGRTEFDADKVFARIEQAALLEAELGQSAAHDVAFHMTDWLNDLSAYVRFCRDPESFTAAQVDELLLALLFHAPNHLAAAAKLYADVPVSDVFKVGAVSADPSPPG